MNDDLPDHQRNQGFLIGAVFASGWWMVLSSTGPDALDGGMFGTGFGIVLILLSTAFYLAESWSDQ